MPLSLHSYVHNPKSSLTTEKTKKRHALWQGQKQKYTCLIYLLKCVCHGQSLLDKPEKHQVPLNPVITMELGLLETDYGILFCFFVSCKNRHNLPLHNT